jgi:cytochrome c oxidase assembly factor CtaG
VFWWALLHHTRQTFHYGLYVLTLFLAMLQGTLFGILIVFSKQVWYESYGLSGAIHQFDALQDQQFAGIIMWLPGGLIYTLLASYYLLQWLNHIEAITQMHEMRRQQHV